MTKETEYKVQELTRHFGTIVGTPGISDEVKDHCNNQLLKLVKLFDEAVKETTAEASGLILENG